MDAAGVGAAINCDNQIKQRKKTKTPPNSIPRRRKGQCATAIDVAPAHLTRRKVPEGPELFLFLASPFITFIHVVGSRGRLRVSNGSKRSLTAADAEAVEQASPRGVLVRVKDTAWRRGWKSRDPLACIHKFSTAWDEANGLADRKKKNSQGFVCVRVPGQLRSSDVAQPPQQLPRCCCCCSLLLPSRPVPSLSPFLPLLPAPSHPSTSHTLGRSLGLSQRTMCELHWPTPILLTWEISRSSVEQSLEHEQYKFVPSHSKTGRPMWAARSQSASTEISACCPLFCSLAGAMGNSLGD